MQIKHFIVIVALSVVLILSVCAYCYFNVPKEVIVMKLYFQVDDDPNRIGFNLEADKMHFGTLCPGCTASRKFSLANNGDYPEKVKFYFTLSPESCLNCEVNLSKKEPLLFVVPSSGTILPAYSMQEFEAKIYPQGLSEGNYSGEVVIKLYPALFVPSSASGYATSGYATVSPGSCWSAQLVERWSCR
jgi:hypothetical protein